MRFLLDTHVFLWWLFEDPRLKSSYRDHLVSSQIPWTLSQVSLWEIAIKVSLNKIDLGMTFEAFLDRHVIDRPVDLINIKIEHLLTYTQLPLHHKDPFDRLLIAQAMAEGLPVLSQDANFKKYPQLKVL